MTMPKFDPTINVGHLAIIVVWIIGIIMAYSSILRTTDEHGIRIRSLEVQVDRSSNMQQDYLRTLSNIQQDIAVIKSRIERREETQ